MKTSATFLVLLIPALAAAADVPLPDQTFFTTYCVKCHGASQQKGDVRLDDVSSIDAAGWQAVFEQLACETMPPDDERQPTRAERRAVAEAVLSLAKEGSAITATGLRRLNKREYVNTVHDLLGLKDGTFDAGAAIYDDEIDEGFDTAAESLVISNELLLEYMDAAEKSLRQALFSVEPTRPQSESRAVNIARMQGVGGGRYINNTRDGIVCRMGGKAMVYDGQPMRTIHTPGRYVITVTAAGVDRDNYAIRFQPTRGPVVLGFGVAPDAPAGVAGDPRLLQTFDLKDDVEQTFRIETWIDKDHYPYFSFVNGSSKPITQVRAGVRQRKIDRAAERQPYAGPGVRISRFEIEGPLYDEWPPASVRTALDTREIPDLSTADARRQVVQRFARRAFRRTVEPEVIAPYLDYLDRQFAATSDRRESLVWTFAAMMASIDFLYIREEPGELDAHALANRLSYFFWSTMPDNELIELADSGRLKESAVLHNQVERLLDDPRSNRFSRSFADQWLSLDKLGSMPPDTKGEFRAYYSNRLEPAMLEETRRYFHYVLHENRSVRDFVDSDYSFVNAGLAELYRVPFEGNGKEFRRIIFPSGSPRGGVLTQGSVLTLTANGVDTSPVERGVWVLRDLLGTPTPPPPKEVPALTPDLNGAETVRDMLEKHRSDAACMECHRRIDPLGFALESFDPIGRERTRYSPKQAVSTQGRYLGQDFADVTELKRLLASDVRPFARNLVVRLAEYAKGRELIPADHVFVEPLVNEAEANDFRFRDIVLAIARSPLMSDR
jgi:hypothetical protein